MGCLMSMVPCPTLLTKHFNLTFISPGGCIGVTKSLTHSRASRSATSSS